jgi:hypothetical protein
MRGWFGGKWWGWGKIGRLEGLIDIFLEVRWGGQKVVIMCGGEYVHRVTGGLGAVDG